MPASYDPHLVLDWPNFARLVDIGGTRSFRDGDIFTNGNHGVPQNFAGTDVELIDTPYGQGVDMAAASTKSVEVAATNNMGFGPGSFSAEVIIKLGSVPAGTHEILHYNFPSYSSGGWLINQQGNAAYIYVDQGPPQINAGTYFSEDVGRWVHMFLVCDSEADLISLYKNGLFYQSAPGTGWNILDAKPLGFGETTWASPDATWARIRVWSKAVSRDEIWNRYINAKRV